MEQNWFWDGASPEIVEALNKATDEAENISSNAAYRDFRGIAPNTDVRTGFTSEDYFYFRDTERVPEKHEDILKICKKVYDKVGIVNNFINLMSEFGSAGIRLVHPNPRIAVYFKQWFRTVQGQIVSEKILNGLYKSGISILGTNSMQAIPPQTQRLLVKSEMVSDNSIPIGYRFVDPLSVDIDQNDKIGQLTGKPSYILKLPAGLKEGLKKADSNQLSTLPQEILSAIKKNKTQVPLPSNIRVFHYRKDDWEKWAHPITYCVLDDIFNYMKMKLADRVALDGAVQKTRVWKLGDLEHKIMPSDVAVNKFKSLLMNNVGGGFNDIIWTPALDLIETGSESYQFLGQDKYKPTLSAIYTGFGVPSLLSGDGQGGMTNNFVAVKILIERLMFGRTILIDFWNAEIEKVRKAKGFRLPAIVEFDDMNLTEENAILALYIQLWDRGLISDELVRTRFGEESFMEEVRVRRENKLRDSEQLPMKVGPYHVDKQFELQKIKTQKQQPKGVAGQGRPDGSKDKKKRKRKQAKPLTNKSKAEWAFYTQSEIVRILAAPLEDLLGEKLEDMGAKNSQIVGARIYSILSQLEIGQEVTEGDVIRLSAQTSELGMLNEIYSRVEPQKLNECLKLNISALLIEKGV